MCLAGNSTVCHLPALAPPSPADSSMACRSEGRGEQESYNENDNDDTSKTVYYFLRTNYLPGIAQDSTGLAVHGNSTDLSFHGLVQWHQALNSPTHIYYHSILTVSTCLRTNSTANFLVYEITRQITDPNWDMWPTISLVSQSASDWSLDICYSVYVQTKHGVLLPP